MQQLLKMVNLRTKIVDPRTSKGISSSPSDVDRKYRSSPASSCPMGKGCTSTSAKLNTNEMGDHAARSTLDGHVQGIFPFLKLPAELREQIYFFAVQPITPLDTAAIPGTPDRVTVPTIAHVSKQTRDEALHVLFKHRPVEVSLHSPENLRRALVWADKWSGHTAALAQIIFCGRLQGAGGDFFHVTLVCSEEKPYFRVHTQPGASTQADILTARLKTAVLRWLEHKLEEANNGQEGRLSCDELTVLIHKIVEVSKGTP